MEDTKKISCLFVIVFFIWSGCIEEKPNNPNNLPDGPTFSCIDEDKDGYGGLCLKGPDCDDSDPSITVECLVEPETPDCSTPAEGCPCDEEGRVISCRTRTPVELENGSLLCFAGERICENGAWSECRNVATRDVTDLKGSFENEEMGRWNQTLEGPPIQCDECSPECMTAHTCPSDLDITEENSDNVIFDPFEGGGIILIDKGREGYYQRIYSNVCPAGFQPVWWSVAFNVLNYDLNGDQRSETEVKFIGIVGNSLQEVEQKLLRGEFFTIATVPPDSSPTNPDDPRDIRQANLFNALQRQSLPVNSPYILIRVILRSLDRVTSPRVFSFDLYWFCLESL